MDNRMTYVDFYSLNQHQIGGFETLINRWWDNKQLSFINSSLFDERFNNKLYNCLLSPRFQNHIVNMIKSAFFGEKETKTLIDSEVRRVSNECLLKGALEVRDSVRKCCEDAMTKEYMFNIFETKMKKFYKDDTFIWKFITFVSFMMSSLAMFIVYHPRRI